MSGNSALPKGKTSIGVAGGVGLALTAMVKGAGETISATTADAILYAIPAISAFVGELYRRIAIFGEEFLSDWKISRTENKIRKSLNDPLVPESIKKKLRARYGNLALIKSDPRIAMDVPSIVTVKKEKAQQE